MPRFGNGTHLHLEKKNQKKEEDGELKLPFCRDLAMCPISNKKNEKKEEQAPFLPNLGDGVLKATKKRGSMLPFYPRVGDGVAKTTQKQKKKGLAPPPPVPRSNKKKRKKKGSWPLLKVGDGTHQNQNKKIK
jgi:hypothetical protein